MSDGEAPSKPVPALEAQVAKLEEELSAERQRSLQKDQKIEMMEAVVTRLQSRVELLQDHLKEQERKNRIAKGNSEAVLELQQQLAEELSKRKQAQYELIAKAKELCDVQQKMAGAGDTKDSSHEAKKELQNEVSAGAVSWSPASSQPKLVEDSRRSPGASRGASGASLASPVAASPVSAASPSLMLPLSGLSVKSSFHQCPTSNTPQTPPTSRSSGRTSPALRLPGGEAMADRVQNQRRSPVVPPVRKSSQSVLVRPPADEEGAHIFNPARYVRSAHDRVEPPKPVHLHHPQDAAFGVHGSQSGHITPVSPMFHNVHLDYPRILTARSHEVRMSAAAAKSAVGRVMSPPLSARVNGPIHGPLVLPAAQVVVCEAIHI
eukprot:s3149_g6.t1